MKMKSFLSNALCILILCTGYTLTSCTEGPIDNEDLKETEDKEYVDMGTAAYRIDELTATTATFTGNLKVTAAELQSPSQVTVYYTSGDVLDFDTAKWKMTEFLEKYPDNEDAVRENNFLQSR